jgi:acyl-CoA thioester hydrolase
VNSAIIRTTYKDTDQMGVVYYGNYLTYFETGRTEFIRALGFSYRDMEAEGITLPVLECSCKYISPVLYDEEISVETSISEVKGLRMRIDYVIRSRESGAIHATGHTVHAFIGKDMKPIRINRSESRFINAIKNAVNG